MATVDFARGVAKTWVRFNGTGVVAINDSENVDSITDNGTGAYTINITQDFAAADYCFVGMARDSASNVNVNGNVGVASVVGSHAIVVVTNGGGANDAEEVCVAHFGNLA